MHYSDDPALVWLDDPQCQNATLVGNKGATLGLLRQRGYPVPDGFCITTDALSQSRDAWEDDVERALQRLPPPWAVRSSSTAEDSRGLAFAGLFMTLLDVPDARSVCEAAEQVRSSASNLAVTAYAAHHAFDTESIRMAALVQRLVLASSAGVAFSRDPVTGADHVAIEGNYGLGETVVDGSVTPDSYCVDAGGAIVERRVGSKREKVIATTAGARVRRLPTSELERAASVLDDAQILAVAQLTRDLVDDLGLAVDVEWAFAENELVLLQARPITTGPSPAAPR